MYPNFIKYSNPIENTTCISNNNDKNYNNIILQTSIYKINITPVGDCCSYSWIENYQDSDFNFLNGKIISKIKEINYPNDYKYIIDNIDDDECITPHLYEITFKNTDDTFRFQLINCSNGYYDGYLDINILL